MTGSTRKYDGYRVRLERDGDRARLFSKGGVSKHRDRAYRRGRSNHWIKIKNPSSPAMRRAAEVD